MPEVKRKKLCGKVSKVKMICDDWEFIVRNLTDPRMTHVDARRFGIRQFYKARSIDFCLDQQRIYGPKEQTEPENQEFSEHKYQEVKNSIVTTNILSDVSHSKEQGKLLSTRLKIDIDRMCQT